MTRRTAPQSAAPRRTAPESAARGRKPAGDDAELVLPLDLPASKLGRHERAVARQLLAAQRSGRLDAQLHAGLASTLRGLGRALDGAERKADPYAAAQVARVLLDTLDRSGLLPGGDTRDTDDGPLGELLTLGRAARGSDS